MNELDRAFLIKLHYTPPIPSDLRGYKDSSELPSNYTGEWHLKIKRFDVPYPHATGCPRSPEYTLEYQYGMYKNGVKIDTWVVFRVNPHTNELDFVQCIGFGSIDSQVRPRDIF